MRDEPSARTISMPGKSGGLLHSILSALIPVFIASRQMEEEQRQSAPNYFSGRRIVKRFPPLRARIFFGAASNAMLSEQGARSWELRRTRSQWSASQLSSLPGILASVSDENREG
jgi:hypothetical protein